MAWWVSGGPRRLQYAARSQVAFGGFLWVVLGLPQSWAHTGDLVSVCSEQLPNGLGGHQEETKGGAFWEATFFVFLAPWDAGTLDQPFELPEP